MNYKIKSIFPNLHILSAFVLTTLLLGGCEVEDKVSLGSSGGTRPLELIMDINGLRENTRAERSNKHDEWSYTEFEAGDKMGFYASGGNSLENDGPFVNQELIYTAREDENGKTQMVFLDPEGIPFSPSSMDGKEVYMYYPYNAIMAGSGMVLRTYPQTGEETEIPRCIDMLSSSELTIFGDKNALYGSFHHGFSELIIVRGDGFDQPTDETIKVVINKSCTNIKVNYDPENGWNCAPELVFDPDNEMGLDEKGAKAWYAWKGGNYSATLTDEEGEEAWYVILPTIGESGFDRSSVEYIELYDNEGNLQQVSSLKLSGATTTNPTKYLDSGWRFPVKINMTELGPTINPYPIQPWEDNVDLTDSRERGINDAREFQLWVSDYNAYLADKENPEKIQNLLKYGDRIINGNDGEVTWIFYLVKDIDLSKYVPLPGEDDGTGGDTGDGDIVMEFSVILQNFNDVLDGKSTNLSNGRFLNNKISGLSKPFVGNLSGTIRNLDFIRPDVRSSNSSIDAMGIISNKMNAATISNCNIINGTLINANGPAGMVTGNMTGVGNTIQDCEINGFMVYGNTVTDPEEAAYLVGDMTASSSNNFSGNNVDIVPEKGN